jgi:hypothetical protein
MEINRNYYLNWEGSDKRRDKISYYKGKGYEIIVDTIAVI